MKAATKSLLILACCSALVTACSGSTQTKSEKPAEKPHYTPPAAASDPVLNLQWEQSFKQTQTLAEVGKSDESLQELEKALALSEKFGKQDERYLITLQKLAGEYRARGRIAEAERCYLEHLHYHSIGFGAEDQSSIFTLNKLAQIETGRKNFSKAKQYCRRGIDAYAKQLVPDAETIALLHLNYGTACFGGGEIDEAMTHFKKSLKVMDDQHDHAGYAVMVAAGGLGECYLLKKQYKLAYDSFNDAVVVSMSCAIPPEQLETMARQLHAAEKVGDDATIRKDYDATISHAEKAMQSDINLPHTKRVRTAIMVELHKILLKYSSYLEKSGRKDQAKQMRIKADKLASKYNKSGGKT